MQRKYKKPSGATSQGKMRGWLHQVASKVKHLVGKSLPGSTSSARKHTPEKSSPSREQASDGSEESPRESPSIPRHEQNAEPLAAQAKTPEQSKSPGQPDRFWNVPTTYLAGVLAAPSPKAVELPLVHVPQLQHYQIAENLAAQEQLPGLQLEAFWHIPTHCLASMIQAPPPEPTELPQIDQGPLQYGTHQQQQKQQKLEQKQQRQEQKQQKQQRQEQKQEEQRKLEQKQQKHALADALLPFADVRPQFASDMPMLGESLPTQQTTWQVPRQSQGEREHIQREQIPIQPPPRMTSRCSTHEQRVLREQYLLEREMLEFTIEHMRSRERSRRLQRARELERARTHDLEFSPGSAREPTRQNYTLGPIPLTFRDVNDFTLYHERVYQEHSRNTRGSRDVYSRPSLPDRFAPISRSPESLRDPYSPLSVSYPYASPTPHRPAYGYSSPRKQETTPTRDVPREQSHARRHRERRAYTEDRADGRCNTCVDTQNTRKTRVSNNRIAAGRTPEHRTQNRVQPPASSHRRVKASPPTLLTDEDDRYTSDDASQASFSDPAYDLDAFIRDLWPTAHELRGDAPGLTEEEDDDASLRWTTSPPPKRTTRGYVNEKHYRPPNIPLPPLPEGTRRARASGGKKHHAPPVRTPTNLPALMPAFHMPPAYGV